MKILYIGAATSWSTSRHRADALGRLGHQVTLADPEIKLAHVLRGRLRSALHYRSGYRLVQSNIFDWIIYLMKDRVNDSPDLVWINGGELLGYKAVSKLKALKCPLVLYNNDDPTGKRDGRRFDSLLNALPIYDLCVVRNLHSIPEYQKYGAKSVHRVYMSYDEVVHTPFDEFSQISEQFISDVAFVGTWIRGEGRDRFLLGLIERGLNVAIWGGRWQKAPVWSQLQPYWRGEALSGRDYVSAIQGAKISIGMLSHGNRDLHTRRSVEIPYAGGLLCAERTSEHLQLYHEGEEAVFWSDVDECAKHCHDLLANPEKRERIRLAGMKRVRNNQLGNEDICRQILAKVFS